MWQDFLDWLEYLEYNGKLDSLAWIADLPLWANYLLSWPIIVGMWVYWICWAKWRS